VDDAVDERSGAGGIREGRGPVLEREVGREHEALLLVAAADDLKEQVCSESVASAIEPPLGSCASGASGLPYSTRGSPAAAIGQGFDARVRFPLRPEAAGLAHWAPSAFMAFASPSVRP
jgi:hypothetical protein